MSSLNKSVFLVFLFTIATDVCFAKIETVLGIPLSKNLNLAGTIPTSLNSEIIISRSQYVISYNRLRRAANWVAWKLEASQLGDSGRSSLFAADPDLEQYLKTHYSNAHAVSPAEYKGSCYDRGHQIPSADRTDTIENNEMTFLMSNMIPQTPFLNRGMWANLEAVTRRFIKNQNKIAYLVAGPIYDSDFGHIGPNKDIPVPSKNFKIVVLLDADQTLADINAKTPMISVIMPNILADGTNPKLGAQKDCVGFSELARVLDEDDWKDYRATVSQIESQSQLTIFASLNDVQAQ